MIKLALRNGVGVAVAAILISIFGMISLFRVPVQMTPDMTATSISVITAWPGATPQDIEKEILIEQEKYLRSIPNLEKMTSKATTGRAEVVLEFFVGADLDEILVRANNALSQVPSYPENVDQPRIVTSSASDQPIAWFSIRPLPGNPDGIDIVAMQDFVEDNVQTEMERTPGVSQSEIFGGAPRQLRIYIDPGKLAERGISLGELRTALRLRNRDVSGGDFDEGKRRYLLRTVGRFKSIDDIEGTLIARRDRAPIYLRDVGHVELDRAETRAQVRHNGEVALAINARRQPGTNIIEVMDNVKETVARLNAGIMKDNGMIIRQVSDDTVYIREAVKMVRNNLMLGGVLATLTLLLFLRSVPATMIGALAVPICSIASFLGLVLAGRTVNVISLAGVAFAIGMTLDNGIVVLENIYRHRSMGKSLFEAAYDGTREVWGAVLASTLTTVFVFIPIVFVEEEAGQLFKDISIAIASAIIVSMIVSITVIPAASARYLGHVSEEPRTKFGRAYLNLFGLAPFFQGLVDRLMRVVEWLMKGIVRRLVLVVGMFCLSIFITIFLTPQTEYLPEGRKNLVFAFMFPPPGYNVQEMVRIGEGIEKDFLPYVGNDPSLYHEGKSDVPAMQDFFFINTTSFLLVITKAVEPDDLDDIIPHLMERLNQVPGMIAFASRPSIFSSDLLGARGIDLDIQGTELPPLFDVARKAFGKTMQELSHSIRPDPPSLSMGQPLLEIQPDWERAAALGIDTQQLGYLVWALTDGAYVDEFFLADDKIDMYLYSTTGTVSRTQDLEDLLLYTSNGGTVPLASVAKVVPTVNTETIRRVDRRRTVTLSIKPPMDIPLEEAVNITEKNIIGGLMADGSVPAGVELRVAGANDKLKATREALGGNFLLAIVISYLLMVALFSHWGYPLVIMTSLPLGLVGGIVGLWLMNHTHWFLGFLGAEKINQPLDVITMLGFVILVGTVVNNPILIVEQTLQHIREDGYDPLKAVVESTRTRVRPIMMTTATTTFGLAPLVFLPGSGTELYRGLGTVVLFGLGFSTLFTLTFIPSLLSLFLQWGAYLHQKRLEVQDRLVHTEAAVALGLGDQSEELHPIAPVDFDEEDETPEPMVDSSPPIEDETAQMQDRH